MYDFQFRRALRVGVRCGLPCGFLRLRHARAEIAIGDVRVFARGRDLRMPKLYLHKLEMPLRFLHARRTAISASISALVKSLSAFSGES
jgi:hypothetical protein